MVEALRAVPEWMLDRDGFEDVFVGIYVRNVLVGVGFVHAKDDDGVASAGLLPLDLPNTQASTSYFCRRCLVLGSSQWLDERD